MSRAGIACGFALVGLVTAPGHGQGTHGLPDAPEPPAGAHQPPASRVVATTAQDDLPLTGTPKRLVDDEWGIVRSPAYLRKRDLRWLVPLAGATAATLATDTHVMRTVVTHDPGTVDASESASGAIRDVLIAAPIALFGVGQLTAERRSRDAGLLAGEAMINAFVSDEGIKYLTWRERPALQNSRGHFFSSDAASDPSFVSGHAMVAWSSAAALAGEYSKPWQQISLYTLAGGASFTRVLAQQHFPSDVLLGSACGWLIGHYVYKRHRGAR